MFQICEISGSDTIPPAAANRESNVSAIAIVHAMSSSSTSPPKTTRYKEKREAILAAAARQFNERGVKDATLSEIAASVGLVTSGITYYYRKKEDLAAACLLRAIAEDKKLALEAARETGVTQRVTRLFMLHAERLAAIDSGEQPPLIGFSDIRALPDAQAATVFTAYNDLFRCVRALLASPEAAALSRDARNARAHLLISSTMTVSFWISRCEIDEYPSVARRIADIVLHGVIKSATAWPGDAALDSLRLPEPPPAPDETAEAFLQAATELVNEQGYRGASVDRIAALLNATKGKFYHYNETKIDLITACFERSFALQRHFLKAAALPGGAGSLRVCAAAMALVRFQLSPRGPLLRNAAYSALPDQQHRQQVYRTMQRVIERMVGLLVDGLVDGSVRPQDPAIAAQVLDTAINAAAELRRWVPGISEDNITRLYTRPSLLGLLCDE